MAFEGQLPAGVFVSSLDSIMVLASICNDDNEIGDFNITMLNSRAEVEFGHHAGDILMASATKTWPDIFNAEVVSQRAAVVKSGAGTTFSHEYTREDTVMTFRLYLRASKTVSSSRYRI